MVFGNDAIAFVSPIDVILHDAEIVQPDVVVARRGQVSDRGIEGAPPLLGEVVSPTGRASTARSTYAATTPTVSSGSGSSIRRPERWSVSIWSTNRTCP